MGLVKGKYKLREVLNNVNDKKLNTSEVLEALNNYNNHKININELFSCLASTPCHTKLDSKSELEFTKHENLRLLNVYFTNSKTERDSKFIDFCDNLILNFDRFDGMNIIIDESSFVIETYTLFDELPFLILDENEESDYVRLDIELDNIEINKPIDVIERIKKYKRSETDNLIKLIHDLRNVEVYIGMYIDEEALYNNEDDIFNQTKFHGIKIDEYTYFPVYLTKDDLFQAVPTNKSIAVLNYKFIDILKKIINNVEELNALVINPFREDLLIEIEVIPEILSILKFLKSIE